MTAALAPALDALAADPGADLRAGLELRRAGDLVGADAAVRRAADAGDATALWMLGLARFEAGDAAAAERLVARAADLRSGDAQIALTLANLRQHLGDAPGAALAFGRACALAPGDAGALVGLAQSLLASGKASDALAAAEAAVAVAPGNAEAQLALAGAFAALKRPREAAEAFRRAGELAPASAPARLGEAVQRLQLGDAAAALAAAERAVALDETTALGWLTLGAALRRLGRLEPAAAALERALMLEPRQRGALLGLGLIYTELDRPAPAERRLKEALGLDSDDADAHAALSGLYCNTDRFTLGRAHAERALALDPALLNARQNLARALAAEGRPVEARQQRDLAYSARCLFAAEGPAGAPRVLILASAGLGNTPDRRLLPVSHCTRLVWVAEYATAAQSRALPTFDVVFNGIGDADEAGGAAANVARFLQGCDAPVLNHPARIERTRRHLAPALLGDIDGLVVPACARLGAEELASRGLVEAARRAGIESPFIVRPVGSHGGKQARLVATSAAAPQLEAGDHYVTAFHDARSDDRLFRKHRMIFVGGEAYPYHLAIGPNWLVHYETSGTAAHPERRAEELRFLEDPGAVLGRVAMDAVRAIGQRLQLDFAGIDFAVLADGRALLFEANATMLVHPEDPTGPLAHKNPFVARILDAFWELLADKVARGANRANVEVSAMRIVAGG